jgi:hypothetical protein
MDLNLKLVQLQWLLATVIKFNKSEPVFINMCINLNLGSAISCQKKNVQIRHVHVLNRWD